MSENNIFLQTLYLLVISIIMVLLAPYFTYLTHGLLGIYSSVEHFFSEIFTSSYIGTIITRVLALTLIPVLIALIPAIIFWIIKRRKMPCFVLLMWIAWLVLATTVVLS